MTRQEWLENIVQRALESAISAELTKMLSGLPTNQTVGGFAVYKQVKDPATGAVRQQTAQELLEEMAAVARDMLHKAFS